MSNIKLEDCPFCGHVFREEDMDDAVYPASRTRELWQCGCVVCTATVYGESAEHAISEWNVRHINKPIQH